MAVWVGALGQVTSAKKTRNYPTYYVTHHKPQTQNLQIF